jgi:hypothetical protein
MVAKIQGMQPPSNGNVQAEEGIDKLAELPQVTEVVVQLPYSARCASQATRFTRNIHFMSLEFKSTEQSKLVRQHIIEKHKGVEWPPVAIVYVWTKFVLRKDGEDV